MPFGEREVYTKLSLPSLTHRLVSSRTLSLSHSKVQMSLLGYALTYSILNETEKCHLEITVCTKAYRSAQIESEGECTF